MSVLTPGRIIGQALLLAAASLAAAPATAQPGKEPGPKDRPEAKVAKDRPEAKAAKDLRKAYDRLSDLADAPGGKEIGKLIDHARTFYRDAVAAFPEDPRKAGELAVAANDAVRGVDHLRRATRRPAAGLPEPPAVTGEPIGPKGPRPGDDGKPGAEARTALEHARDRLADAPAKGPARDFFVAAKTAYARGRDAYEAGEYQAAAEFGRAAEAWTHVPEHLDRAEADGPAPAEPRKRGPGVPPPPPPVQD